MDRFTRFVRSDRFDRSDHESDINPIRSGFNNIALPYSSWLRVFGYLLIQFAVFLSSFPPSKGSTSSPPSVLLFEQTSLISPFHPPRYCSFYLHSPEPLPGVVKAAIFCSPSPPSIHFFLFKASSILSFVSTRNSSLLLAFLHRNTNCRRSQKHKLVWILLFMERFHSEDLEAFFVGVLVAIVVVRIAYVIYWTGKPHRMPQQRFGTLIVLGSGGHTAEMLNIVNVLLKDRFVPRFYIAASTDNLSLQKARVLEESLIHKEEIGKRNIEEVACFEKIYRSREVGQSYLTSICTTMVAMVHALWIMLKIRPEVIICNGPGTCIPLCLIAFMFKVAGVRWSSIFYIESIARVRRLSLSGLLLYKFHIADQFYVQWSQLQRKYPRSHYVGRLM